jgi:hypothetical protein
MDTKKLNKVLAEMDDLPETMTPMGFGVSAALIGRRGRTQGPTPPETVQRMKAVYAARPMEEKQEIAAKISKGNSNPCTVDGITIYPSLKALVAALGSGKTGRKHPNFRFTERVAPKRGSPSPETRAKMGNQKVKGGKISPEALANRGKGPCTIDGITIYSSRKVLVQTLGNGKNGAKHPNFRYVQRNEKEL